MDYDRIYGKYWDAVVENDITIPDDIITLFKQVTTSNGRFSKARLAKLASETQKQWLDDHRLNGRLVFVLIKIGSTTVPSFRCKKCQTLLKQFAIINKITNLLVHGHITIKDLYPMYCSYTCSARDKDKQLKIATTNQQKYGVSSVLQNKEILNRKKNTMVERYGESYGAVIAKKCGDSIEKKYGKGIRSHFSVPEIQSKIQKSYRTRFYESFKQLLLERNIELIMTLEEYTEASVFRYKCTLCGKEWEDSDHDVYHMRRCECCRGIVSHLERNIRDIVNKHYVGNVKYQDRKLLNGYEVDIVLPDIKVAFEINGSYWHSEELISTKQTENPHQYHQFKTLTLNQQGYKLIHLFEYEWRNDERIIERKIINAICGGDDINASLCNVITKQRKDIYPATIKEVILEKDKKKIIELHILNNTILDYTVFGNYRLNNLLHTIDPDNLIKFIDVDLSYQCINDILSDVKYQSIGISEPRWVYVRNEKIKPCKFVVEYDNDQVMLQPLPNDVYNGWNKVYDCGRQRFKIEGI